MAEKRGWNDQYFYSYPGIKEEKAPCSKCQKYAYHGFGRPPRPPYPGMPPYGRPPRPPYPRMPPYGRPPQPPPPPPQRPPVGFRPGRNCGCKGMSEMYPEMLNEQNCDEIEEVDYNQCDDLYMVDTLENEKIEQDWLYLKQLYPNGVRKLLKYVDDVLDKLEYEHSLMFDEMPDKVAIDQLIKNMIEMIQDNEPVLLKSENWLNEKSDTSDNSMDEKQQNQMEGDAKQQTWCPYSETILYVVLLAEMHHRRWRYFRANV